MADDEDDGPYHLCGQDDRLSPWPMFERMIDSHEELIELREMMDSDLQIAFFMRRGEWTKDGRERLGMTYLPVAQGELRPFFVWALERLLGYPPAFIIMFNEPWWEVASDLEREALLFHELMHCGIKKNKQGEDCVDKETGQPTPAIRPHDVEEFNAVVQRYGQWKGDLRAFFAAAASGPGTNRPTFVHELVEAEEAVF